MYCLLEALIEFFAPLAFKAFYLTDVFSMSSIVLTLSIVSHGQASLVKSLLSDLEKILIADLEIIITVNMPEDDSILTSSILSIKIIRNSSPKGFGANHNSAFEISRGKYFAIVNPDVRISNFNLDFLIFRNAHLNIGAWAPLVLNSNGGVEDSARFFPTFSSTVRRLFFRRRSLDYNVDIYPLRVDWVAGMFIVFKREAFKAVGGFDDRRFFMYFEDVDICERLSRNGWSVVLDPRVSVIHDAQRASHRNWLHFRWHLTSAIRYLTGL